MIYCCVPHLIKKYKSGHIDDFGACNQYKKDKKL